MPRALLVTDTSRATLKMFELIYQPSMTVVPVMNGKADEFASNLKKNSFDVPLVIIDPDQAQNEVINILNAYRSTGSREGKRNYANGTVTIGSSKDVPSDLHGRPIEPDDFAVLCVTRQLAALGYKTIVHVGEHSGSVSIWKQLVKLVAGIDPVLVC